MSPAIRDYHDHDRAGVGRLIVAVLSEFGFAAHARRVEADLDDVEGRYVRPWGGFWVAEEAGSIVGSVAIRRKENRTAELKRLYVLPALRGVGLGQRLYSEAESFARGAGYANIWLDSSRRFTQARGLYERNGYVLLQALDNEWEDNVYQKSLAGRVNSPP